MLLLSKIQEGNNLSFLSFSHRLQSLFQLLVLLSQPLQLLLSLLPHYAAFVVSHAHSYVHLDLRVLLLNLFVNLHSQLPVRVPQLLVLLSQPDHLCLSSHDILCDPVGCLLVLHLSPFLSFMFSRQGVNDLRLLHAPFIFLFPVLLRSFLRLDFDLFAIDLFFRPDIQLYLDRLFLLLFACPTLLLFLDLFLVLFPASCLAFSCLSHEAWEEPSQCSFLLALLVLLLNSLCNQFPLVLFLDLPWLSWKGLGDHLVQEPFFFDLQRDALSVLIFADSVLEGADLVSEFGNFIQLFWLFLTLRIMLLCYSDI